MKRPNVLLLISDHHRGDWMPYDDETLQQLAMDRLPLKMPVLRQLMDDGITFTQCTTPSPLCAPARASLASGLNYEHCQVADNGVDYPVDQPTFYTVLKDAGYSVGGVGKFDLHKPTLFWGLDGWVDDLGTMGFTHAIDNEGKWAGYQSGQTTPQGPYMKYLYDRELADVHLNDFRRRREIVHDTDPTDLPEEAYCDNWLTDNGIQMIRDFKEDNPWFLQVNFTGPHDPWDITASMKAEWKDVDFPQPVGGEALSDEKHRMIRQNFAAMLSNIDRNIGRLLDEVERRGELDNTIIIYSADHGEMLGDRNLFGKNIPYRGSVSIPLVIAGPDMRSDRITSMPVQLHDLAKTIVECCGLDMPEAMDSVSLKPYLYGEVEQGSRQVMTSGLHEWRMEQTETVKKIYRHGQLEEVYDLQNDPWEMNNIVDAAT